MFLYQVLRTNPFGSFGVGFCLVTAWLSMRAVKGRLGPDRFLLGVLGLLSVFQGLRILIDQSGGRASVFQQFQGLADAATSTLFLVAILVLRASIAKHVNTSMTLRLVESEKRISAPLPPAVSPMPSTAGRPAARGPHT